ncbi:hypothetical protein ABI_40520 [Asticcacaulis biprosthecium C19]|uniref:Uncharacterized protein n=2 Tax=Asticcacaulis biprosthecium TaxID=76891 RepID=F4QSA9_9CAUL|nr:hypothetical protein ABI_40520 [Asticcacaulis biprosthecium C19]
MCGLLATNGFQDEARPPLEDAAGSALKAFAAFAGSAGSEDLHAMFAAASYKVTKGLSKNADITGIASAVNDLFQAVDEHLDLARLEGA